jgi:hypothetical protein
VTNDIDTLPSDIKTNYALKYSPNDFKRSDESSFIANLTVEIFRAKGRVVNLYTDSISYQHIFVASAKHGWILNPIMWSHITTIFNYVRNIQHHYDDIYTGHLAQLTMELFFMTRSIYGPNPPDVKKQEHQRAWRIYIEHYDRLEADFRNPLGLSNNNVYEAFSVLKKAAIPGTFGSEQIDISLSFFSNMIEQISAYIKQHESIKHYLLMNNPKSLLGLLSDTPATLQLWGQSEELSRTCKDIVLKANGVIFNMIQIVC